MNKHDSIWPAKPYNLYTWDMSAQHQDELSVSQARDQLPELLNQAAYTGRITYVTRRGQRIGAIVPLEVAEAAEAEEDAYLSRLAAEAEEELASGGTTRPLGQVIADLGLAEPPPPPRTSDDHLTSSAPAPRRGTDQE